MTRSIATSVLLAAAATAVTVGSGSAAAQARDCVIDRWLTGASAHCAGEGTFYLEVTCVGVSFQGFQYLKSKMGRVDDPYPPTANPRLECLIPLTQGQIGIATDVRITDTPTPGAIPLGAWD
ncbi:hypothetical protein LTV02_37535 [Nocardia yamanashiensis]|uniref:hypothetical protein n=1 Tax=Nocardia yamanashiensis TaxID=209247 RepID=UPI001E37DA62|nr:hypothetical protein [Nocardia yamanashiensis]UGT41568.1 hypothetical protein LTV02_37535 [Nocardia yamanashiensis]